VINVDLSCKLGLTIDVLKFDVFQVIYIYVDALQFSDLS
jgi:hypothetical protein